jgi:DNA-binding NarL/FixJ family response regulator
MVRILLADESTLARRGLRALLETRDGFQVCGEAINGREAVELANHLRPDVAVLEIALPILDGIEATRRLRKMIPETEIMIFTLEDAEEKIRAALHAGARGIVLKSEPDDAIIRAVASVAVHVRILPDHLSYLDGKNGVGGQNGVGGKNGVDEKNGTGHHPIALTARELEVVRLIAEGKSNKLIAHLLDISTKTVETHRSTSMRKLNVHSAAQLVRHAIRCGLIQP